LRRWLVLAAAVAALVGLFLVCVSRPQLRVRYYLWRLERAYTALPTGDPRLLPGFEAVYRYQNALIREGRFAVQPTLTVRHKHDALWYRLTTAVVASSSPPEAKDAFLADTESENAAIVVHALVALQAIPKVTEEDRIIACLYHRSPNVRGTALKVVTKHRMLRAYPKALHILHSDPSPAVRALATGTVARLGGRRAIPELIQALDDTEPFWYDGNCTSRGARFWLTVLTGNHFAYADEWQAWWQTTQSNTRAAADDIPAGAVGSPVP